MAHVLLIGATGHVGSRVLSRLLGDPRFGLVVAPTRRPLTASPKLLNPVVDFQALPVDADWWDVDAVILAVGTTMAKARSREAFREVDHDLPLTCAQLAHGRGATTLALNSAMGANPSSEFFYNRTKGELERDLIALGFRSTTLVRPGLIGGERAEYRLAERAAGFLLGLMAPILPRRLRVNPPEKIAEVLIAGVAAAEPGLRTVLSDQLL